MSVFRFKQFQVDDHGCGQKVCTDSVLLGAWIDVDGAMRILDLGCGCGILALMMAQRCPAARIDAIDINSQAIDASIANFAASPWRESLSAMLADAATFQPASLYDLIICNPPYFDSTLVSPDPDRAQARHSSALSASSALAMAARWLSPQGSIALVTPQCDLVFDAAMQRLNLWRKCHVHTSSGKKATRMLWQFSRKAQATISQSLAIGDPEYKAITSDFYL